MAPMDLSYSPRVRWLLPLLVVACVRTESPPLVLWHTFGPDEAAALTDDLRDQHVAVTLLPFGRAQNRIADVLTRGIRCPDLVRIDATWLPGLAEAGLLDEAPDLTGFLSEAIELAEWRGKRYAMPQALEGLALLYDVRRVPTTTPGWPPRRLDDLDTAARALTRPGRRGLSLRSDGYWFIPFLRAAGGDLDDIAGPAAERALAECAALVRAGVAAGPAPESDEAAREARAFLDDEVALVIGGPWTVAGLLRIPGSRIEEPGGCRKAVRCIELGVVPFPRAADGRAAAPRGGQLWAVPRCATNRAAGWALAAALTAPAAQTTAARRFGTVPTRSVALADASGIAQSLAAILPATRPIPREPSTPRRFDDLTPAVEAALSGDATPAEALAGVARAWHRLEAPH